jgi:hypothetical protein
VGIAGVLLTYRSARNGGQLTLIDGELRSTSYPETLWPCAILDVTDAEADLLLATQDPLAALAEYSRPEVERALYAGIDTANQALQDFLAELADQHGLTALDSAPPSLESLEDQYGAPDPTAFWPEIRLKVSPTTLQQWEEYFGRLSGLTDDGKLRRLLDLLMREVDREGA